jgi:hypothetical protein
VKGPRQIVDWNGSYQFRRVPLPREICGHRTVLRPYLTVILLHEREEFETFALLDTGADFSMLPREVAEVLGIDVDGLPGDEFPFSGVGSGGKGKQVNVSFIIPQGSSSLQVNNHPFIVITDAKEGQTKDLLLGRHPLFHDFDMGFRMGYTDDPEIGKFTMRRVTKRRDATRYKHHPPSLVPTSP